MAINFVARLKVDGYGISNAGDTETSFDETLTNLDTGQYDGTITYNFDTLVMELDCPHNG